MKARTHLKFKTLIHSLKSKVVFKSNVVIKQTSAAIVGAYNSQEVDVTIVAKLHCLLKSIVHYSLRRQAR